MNIKQSYLKMGICSLFCFALIFGSIVIGAADDHASVSVILKNNSGSVVEVELVDQYGGNFKATIEPGTSQNHTLKAGSDIIVGGARIHVVAVEDNGKEIVVAGQ